ncbi:hypothetical protein H0W26_05750, partial [Candidatus Dependentiae bacterium]|nr:hypothetical protein [Candidatus Dependentiae bacterium]
DGQAVITGSSDDKTVRLWDITLPDSTMSVKLDAMNDDSEECCSCCCSSCCECCCTLF